MDAFTILFALLGAACVAALVTAAVARSRVTRAQRDAANQVATADESAAHLNDLLDRLGEPAA